MFPDWSALDAETLHRVIMKCCIKDHCDNCQSWYLPINQSFCYVCVSGGDMTTGSALFVDKDKASDKAMDSSIALMKKTILSGKRNLHIFSCALTVIKQPFYKSMPY